MSAAAVTPVRRFGALMMRLEPRRLWEGDWQ